jgi:hypothetical protein
VQGTADCILETAPQGRDYMDFIYVLGIIAFFVLIVGLALGCARLQIRK